jgi:Dual specificity phosphatase, catalytic domain
VVRLNRKAYHEQDFERAGISHLEQFYVDGSCPPIKILDRVVQAFESVPEGHAIAVHCKAGLGRTGTCIGAYLMKHYRFTASEIIAWMRICRPGCVIGPQQQFLKEIEQRMWQLGDILTKRNSQSSNPMFSRLTSSLNCISPAAGTYSMPCQVKDEEAVVGRAGQAEGLLGARSRNYQYRHGDRKATARAPPTPETPKPKSIPSTDSVAVTPDPPGISKCDGRRWYI